MVSLRSLAAIYFTVTVVGMMFGLTGPLLNLMLKDMGVSGTLIGLNTAVGAIGALALAPRTSVLVARFGVRGVLTFALVMLAVIMCLLKLFPNVWIWFPLRFLLGGSITFLFAISESWINSAANDRNRGRLMGLYIGLMCLAYGIGALCIRFTGVDSWTPFLLALGLAVVTLLPIFLVGRATPDFGTPVTGSVRRHFNLLPAVMFGAVIYGAMELGFFALLPPYLVELNLSVAQAATALAIASFGMVIWPFLIGGLADRLGTSRVLAATALICAMGALTVPSAARDPLILYGSLFLWGGMVPAIYSLGLTIMGSRFRGAELLAANSTYIWAYSLGTLVGPAGFGVLLDTTPVWGLPVALSVCFILYLLALSQQRPTAPASP